ncbi:transcription factor bHLH110 isoform X2 [Momordica charantia]|uniref:Transcription factor bHLH110 isoform X2 n=1 Tax=Momordica charantia TaxID=3673 RepID=A0A6J1CLA6_MOMCH|nr:transcription factor bHLH110 isoform X2 [Momordica charantia]
MESAANLHHHQHQLQDQLLLPSSSSSSSSSLPVIPSYFGLGTSHGWTPNISLNTCNYNPRIFNNGATSIPIRDCGQKNNTSPPLNSSMVQDLGLFQWSSGVNSSGSSFLFHDPQGGKIKEEISSLASAAESFPKFTEMLNNNNSPSCTNQDFDHLKNTNSNDSPAEDLNDLSHKLLIKTLISSGCQIDGGDHIKPGGHLLYSTTTSRPNRGHFAQIYPSINVSNWNLSSPAPPFSNSLDLNLQTPADMLAASAGKFSHSQDNFGIFRETLPDYHDHIPSVPCIPSKMTPFSSEVTEAKRPCNSMEPRVNQQPPPSKKTRLDSRASCPPFKVRKEKLGDRIAALQQLVAPFGKTDTASVLMEAIGYIKFLQNQTLSVPYMKPSCNKASKPTHRSSVEDGSEGQPNRDLRSRGLCLVPFGCLSYVTGDGGGGGGIWPPPGFNGGTS